MKKHLIVTNTHHMRMKWGKGRANRYGKDEDGDGAENEVAKDEI